MIFERRDPRVDPGQQLFDETVTSLGLSVNIDRSRLNEKYSS